MSNLDLSCLHPAETISKLPHYYFPPYITLAHMFSAPQGWSIRNREMTQFVLQYVVNGFAYYPVAGRSYETRQGDLLLHQPKERHSIVTVDSEPYVCISIVFHFGNTPFPYEDLFAGVHLLGNFAKHPIDSMLSQLVMHYRQPGAAHQMQCQGLLMNILAEAAQHKTKSDQTKSDALHFPKLVQVKNYIAGHYECDIRMKDLEQIAALSKNHLLLLFRKYIGMTPHQYLTWVRIHKARELAIQTNLSVSQIAERVGYADVHTFGRMFKKKTGQSLTQFCANLIYREL